MKRFITLPSIHNSDRLRINYIILLTVNGTNEFRFWIISALSMACLLIPAIINFLKDRKKEDTRPYTWGLLIATLVGIGLTFYTGICDHSEAIKQAQINKNYQESTTYRQQQNLIAAFQIIDTIKLINDSIKRNLNLSDKIVDKVNEQLGLEKINYGATLKSIRQTTIEANNLNVVNWANIMINENIRIVIEFDKPAEKKIFSNRFATKYSTKQQYIDNLGEQNTYTSQEFNTNISPNHLTLKSDYLVKLYAGIDNIFIDSVYFDILANDATPEPVNPPNVYFYKEDNRYFYAFETLGSGHHNLGNIFSHIQKNEGKLVITKNYLNQISNSELRNNEDLFLEQGIHVYMEIPLDLIKGTWLQVKFKNVVQKSISNNKSLIKWTEIEYCKLVFSEFYSPFTPYW